MATKQPRQRLSPQSPLVRDHVIIDTQDFVDKETGENITICKYVKPYNEGTPKDPKWVDRVYKEWVSNPEKFELRGLKIRTQISIAE